MTTTEQNRLGRIYQMVNMMTNEKYVGSTFQPLHKRLDDRKRTYDNWLRGTIEGDRKLFQNIHEYGWECFRIELLKEVEVKNKQELYKIEGDWIRKLDTYKNGLNGTIAGRTRKQYQKDEKQKISETNLKWRQNNLKKIKEKDTRWRQNNPVKRREIIENGITKIKKQSINEEMSKFNVNVVQHY